MRLVGPPSFSAGGDVGEGRAGPFLARRRAVGSALLRGTAQSLRTAVRRDVKVTFAAVCFVAEFCCVSLRPSKRAHGLTFAMYLNLCLERPSPLTGMATGDWFGRLWGLPPPPPLQQLGGTWEGLPVELEATLDSAIRRR